VKQAGASHSLQGRLSLSLFASIVLTGAVAGLLSFAWALHDANELLDGTLEDTVSMIASGQMALPDAPAQFPSSEPDNDVVVVPLGRAGAMRGGMATVLEALPDGLHTVTWQRGSCRVVVRVIGSGARVAVAQRTEVRDEIAQHSAIRTLVPLLLLIPLLMFLVRQVVRRTLGPVASLARHMDSNAIGPAARLPEVDVPREIEPFVQSIRRLLHELAEALEQQQRFVANAAHELRSPMAALQLQAANVERVVHGEEALARLDQLRLGLRRMQHLLEQLLSMARSEAQHGEACPVRLAEVTREVLAACVPGAEAKAIDLGMDHCDGELRVAGTAVDLATLLRNAVDNAIKYSPRESVVTVTVRREGQDAVLSVEDEGPGMPAPQLERAFEPFYRVPGARESGSGLGLAIVAAIAKRLGGRATLQPRGARTGLRFEYRQPLVAARDETGGTG
jgi:two-component system OmpR family sensor kinase